MNAFIKGFPVFVGTIGTIGTINNNYLKINYLQGLESATECQ